MEDLKKNIKAHLLICCRQHENKTCCADKNAEQIFLNLKTWLKQSSIKEHIKVSKSSCLGHCQSGITVCIYPQNKWLHEVTTFDIKKKKKMLEDYAK